MRRKEVLRALVSILLGKLRSQFLGHAAIHELRNRNSIGSAANVFIDGYAQISNEDMKIILGMQ